MAASYVTHFIHRALMIVSVAPTFLRMAMLQPMYPGKRRPRQPPPPLTAARARERAPDSTRATAQASRITMADVTEQTPLAATEPRPKSIKRLVASVRRPVSLETATPSTRRLLDSVVLLVQFAEETLER